MDGSLVQHLAAQVAAYQATSSADVFSLWGEPPVFYQATSSAKLDGLGSVFPELYKATSSAESFDLGGGLPRTIEEEARSRGRPEARR